MGRTTERIGARFDVAATGLGFTPPPVPVRLRLLRSNDVWSAYVQTQPGATPGQIIDWLAAWGPRAIELGTRGVLRADFGALPDAWATAFEHVEVGLVKLFPDGAASVTLTGTRAAVQQFAGRLASGHSSVAVRQVSPPEEPRGLLTRPQEEALRAAVSAGYYRIPRPLNLHQLAERMGITAASLSERLRRAEGRVITKYVEAGAVPPPAAHGGGGLEEIWSMIPADLLVPDDAQHIG
jgi:hypothetical protein